MTKEIFTCSPEETENFGASVGNEIKENPLLPRFIALYGDLGVGKTAFVRGLASVLAKDSIVRSPTFAIVNEYRGDGGSLFHFDMYRIEDEDELYSIGFYDYLDRGISVVEWSENIPYALPEHYIKVEISKISPNEPDKRKITYSVI